MPVSGLSRTVRALALFALSSVPVFAAGLSATATYTSVADPNVAGLYDYSITLNNTGTTTIGTLWFGWIPGGNFLTPTPTNVTQPAGWSDTIVSNAQGNSIRWTSTTNLLQAGQSLSGFNFSSTETPAQLLGFVPSGTGAGAPVLTSFVYIAAPFADPGARIVATAETPEPNTILLALTGLGMAAGTIKQRVLSRA